MGKLKIFARTFWKSLTCSSYYKDILSARFSFSLKYLIFLLFLASLLLGIKTTMGLVKIRPQVPAFVSEAKGVVSEIYPNELVLTVWDKKIRTNVIEPYFIDLPNNKQIQTEEYKHLVVIDTRANIDDFNKYASIFLLADDFVVAPDDSGRSYKIYLLSDYLKNVPNGAFLDKKLYQELIAKALPYFDYTPRFFDIVIILSAVLLPVLATAFSLLGKLVYLLIYSLILWLLAFLLKKEIGYKDVYQMSMHGLTLPILLSTLLSVFNKNVPYVYTFVFLVWMTIVIVKQEKKTSVQGLASV